VIYCFARCWHPVQRPAAEAGAVGRSAFPQAGHQRGDLLQGNRIISQARLTPEAHAWEELISA